MEKPKICLTLTGKTFSEDLALLDKYRPYIDICELRADYLVDEERLHLRKFPKLAHMPCILTLRRRIDGGVFKEGEAARTILFARALSFADSDTSKNFEYVDFEEDFHVPSLEDGALAFGTKIIRSVHSMDKPITNLSQRLSELRTTGYEIPKIAFMPNSLDDVTNLFNEASKLQDRNHILIAMGPLGAPSRLLADKLKNYLTYTSAPAIGDSESNLVESIGHIDPVMMNDLYHVRDLNPNTKYYGITGWPLSATSSPKIHNEGYAKNKMDAVYIPVRAESFEQAFKFAETIGIEGMSVTIPHKEAVLKEVKNIDDRVQAIGASNTIVKKNGEWFAYNTDATGFMKSLQEFTGFKNLHHKKVAIIGAGGAARAIAYAVKKLGGNACIFNRTVSNAKKLAEDFGFKYAALSPESASLIKKYSSLIIQTTSKGMNSTGASNSENDPLYFYEFTGKEKVFDIIYVPAETPIMARAKEAGCKTINGYDMLKYQADEQFELFTGRSI